MGFLRHADGVLAPSEAKLVYRIVGRHRLAPQSKVVRIFPRAFDASLLAGISRIASRNLKEGSNVRARYEMTGGGLNVSQVVVNEKSMPGKIKFFTHKKNLAQCLDRKNGFEFNDNGYRDMFWSHGWRLLHAAHWL